MARSPQDDPIFSDMQRNAWNYRHKAGENTAPGALNDMNQSSLTSDTGALNENNMYVNQNLLSNDVYMNKNAYCPPTLDSAKVNEENLSYNGMTNPPRNNYGNAMLSLDNGPFVRVFYDTNNQQLIFPNHQYDLYNRNQCMQDMPMQNVQPNHNVYPEYSNMNNNIHIQQTPMTNNVFNQDNDNSQTHVPTSKILKEFLGNLEPKPNSTGSYSPFGQNYPLNHPDAPTINILQNNPLPMETPILMKQENSPKRNENSPLADTSNKKRIVAEVKPMRPTYSDVLAKNAKNSQSNPPHKTKQQNVDAKPANIKGNNKNEKHIGNIKYSNDETKHKSEKKQPSTISSGSESGDVNIDDGDKQHKQNKKSKNKRSNISRKWSSIDDIPNEGDNVYNNDNESQFVFIETQPEKPVKKEKKNNDYRKNSDSKIASEEESKQNEDNQSEFVFQENQNDSSKVKKKKEKSYHKLAKPVQDKKKNVQNKWRKNKPGYLGLVQNYLEHWGGATWKAIIWFIYLISDVCRMSAHLSFDLCTSVFTQTYVSSQAVWRSTKDWLYRIGDNKYLVYIDRKFGHTRFGFWRKLKWFKKESETDVGNESTKLNANIPLPATGEEAMKRLLACKGKDPYSILGVSVSCTDDDVKRYYRRQAFLVHPDKNQQPGAEEAFKILQHAFDLIGEPARRAAYERRAQESRHAEAAWGELSRLLAQLHDKMEYAANTIRCTNCGRRHKRVLTARPCYAARYCAQCKIRHSAKEGDIWAESSLLGLLVMYYACMDGAVYQITQWASCQRKNLKQLRPDSHAVQYRIVLGSRAAAAAPDAARASAGHDPNLEEFLNNFYSKSGAPGNTASGAPPAGAADAKKRRNKKPKA